MVHLRPILLRRLLDFKPYVAVTLLGTIRRLIPAEMAFRRAFRHKRNEKPHAINWEASDLIEVGTWEIFNDLMQPLRPIVDKVGIGKLATYQIRPDNPLLDRYKEEVRKYVESLS